MVKELLKKIWNGWKRVAHAIGRFQTKVLLTLSYFLVAGPTWFFMRLFGVDPLKRRPPKDGNYWADDEVAGDEDEMARARRQF